MLGIKDIAREMELSPKTVKRWCKLLNVPPTVPGHASNRWSERDARRLIRLWRDYWTARNGNGKINSNGHKTTASL
jgi:hypothetical protein